MESFWDYFKVFVPLFKIVLCILFGIYIVGAIIIFFRFINPNYDVKHTNYKTNEVTIMRGYKRVLTVLGMALIWPLCIHIEKKED